METEFCCHFTLWSWHSYARRRAGKRAKRRSTIGTLEVEPKQPRQQVIVTDRGTDSDNMMIEQSDRAFIKVKLDAAGDINTVSDQYNHVTCESVDGSDISTPSVLIKTEPYDTETVDSEKSEMLLVGLRDGGRPIDDTVMTVIKREIDYDEEFHTSNGGEVKHEPVEDLFSEPRSFKSEDYGSYMDYEWKDTPNEPMSPPHFVPLTLVPTAGSAGLLKIDVDDPLNPVEGGVVKQEQLSDEDQEENYDIPRIVSVVSYSDYKQNVTHSSSPTSEMVVRSGNDSLQKHDTVIHQWSMQGSALECQDTRKSQAVGNDGHDESFKLTQTGSLDQPAGNTGSCTKDLAQDPCPVEKEFEVNQSKESLRGTSRLKHHIPKIPYTCPRCNTSFTQVSDLKQHVKIHPLKRPFWCEECDRSFPRGCDLMRHLLAHSGEKPFKCEQCEKTFALQNQLKVHGLLHSEKKYKCVECGKTFMQKHHLKQHELVHSGERLFKCKHCDKTFQQRGSLTVHMHIHSGKRPYQCHMCKNTFILSNDLKLHLFDHTGERPFKCDHCDKTYQLNGSLKRHMLIHLGKRPFPCHLCDESFKRKKDLRLHLFAHAAGERSFRCDHCDKTFTRGSHLKQHHRVHSGEMPFKCGVCDKVFNQAGNLNRHFKSVHAEDKLYMCDKCTKCFPHLDSLEQHTQEVHSSKGLSTQLC